VTNKLLKIGERHKGRWIGGVLFNSDTLTWRAIPLLGYGGVDATSRKMSRSILVGSGRGGSFNYR